MRATKTQKSKTITKPIINLPESNSNLNLSSQTPIEIALKIDENGMTTASNLYAFLELEPKNFSHWCLRNIKKNKFAIENEDYIVFVVENENPKIGGRPKTDYKITSEFAKKLSMTGNTERHEQARQYFIACEQGLKIATEKLRSFINTDKISNVIENMNITLSYITDRLTKLEEKEQTQSIETTCKKPYNPWFARMQPKYKLLEEYFNITRGKLYHNILLELENLYDIDTQQIQAKYGIANKNDPIASTKHITIFDTPINTEELKCDE